MGDVDAHDRTEASVMNSATDFDVLVVGAGFGGLAMLYRIRELGFSMQGVETGDSVGGTWFWNRYPGARVDIQSVEYSFSMSREVQDEWTWTELMAPQAELERYVNFVADRLDLRRHIKFNTRVTAMTWYEASATWLVETDQGDRWRSRFVVTAVGCLLGACWSRRSRACTASPATRSTRTGSRRTATISPASAWRSSAPVPPGCR